MWFAVQKNRDDDWGYGAEDLFKAQMMLNAQGCGLIAVIDGDVCIDEIEYEEVDG